jgi:hypothetical protein
MSWSADSPELAIYRCLSSGAFSVAMLSSYRKPSGREVARTNIYGHTGSVRMSLFMREFS